MFNVQCNAEDHVSGAYYSCRKSEQVDSFGQLSNKRLNCLLGAG